MTTATLEKRVRVLEKRVKSLDVGQAARTRLRKMILDGLNSGPGKPIDAAFWREMRAHAKRHSTHS